jgi:hypothetical protein
MPTIKIKEDFTAWQKISTRRLEPVGIDEITPLVEDTLSTAIHMKVLGLLE